ncbi:MAG: hypothetical protein P4L16_05290 [Chlamydiales bacterium]|nr:hypothetical protein [Chlamydiales bacterium]
MTLQIHFKPLKWLITAKQLLSILILLAITSLASLYFFPARPLTLTLQKKELSYRHTPLIKQEFQEISVLNTNVEPSKLLLSYLENSLLFLGISERPDKNLQKNKFILGIKNSEEICSFLEEEKIFLSMERDQEDSQLIFHFCKESNASFWIRATCKEANLSAQIGSNKENSLINGCFTLKKTTLPSRKTSWQMNGVRVDPTFLTRKQTKWVGQDLFLKRHGGDAYAHSQGKERIDFLEGYSCFVQEGDYLIWKDECWQEAKYNTEGYPLLHIKKIEEKLMHLVLWPTEGDIKCSITLTKYPELISNSAKTVSLFHYLGAKSWKEFLFEIDGKRVYIRQGDWWLHTEKEWKRLLTPEDIDAYVSHKLKGDLFVVDGVKRVKGNQVLIGHIFNTPRTKVWDIEIPMKQKSTPLLKAYPIIPPQTQTNDDTPYENVPSNPYTDNNHSIKTPNNTRGPGL